MAPHLKFCSPPKQGFPICSSSEYKWKMTAFTQHTGMPFEAAGRSGQVLPTAPEANGFIILAHLKAVHTLLGSAEPISSAFSSQSGLSTAQTLPGHCPAQNPSLASPQLLRSDPVSFSCLLTSPSSCSNHTKRTCHHDLERPESSLPLDLPSPLLRLAFTTIYHSS